MIVESWTILQVSWKVSAARQLYKRPEVFMIPWKDQKSNVLLISTFYYKYLKYKIIYNLGKKQFCI